MPILLFITPLVALCWLGALAPTPPKRPQLPAPQPQRHPLDYHSMPRTPQ
jgi:hypothetical protein